MLRRVEWSRPPHVLTFRKSSTDSNWKSRHVHTALPHNLGGNPLSGLFLTLRVFRLKNVSSSRFQNRAIAQCDLSVAPDGRAIFAGHHVNRDFIRGLQDRVAPADVQHVYRTARFCDPM